MDLGEEIQHFIHRPEIKHFIHEHPLTLWGDYIDTPCLLCRQVISSVEKYSCCNDFCSYDNYIHKSCSKLPQQMLHPFHPQHSLALLIAPPNASVSFKCDACGPIPRSSNYYHCSDCGFNLDVCCSSLMPTKISIVQHYQIQRLGHPHPLILCDNNTIFNFPCSGCRLPVDRSRIYVCLHCNCLLDESCAEWPSQIEHPFHPQHPLTLLVHQTWDSSTSIRCRACGKVLGGGFNFHCSHCNFSLDACCASLEPKPQNNNNSQGNSDEFFSHPHPLIPCEKKKRFRLSCDACQLPFDELDDSLVYVCVECKFLLHKSCADLPLEVKHSFCHHQHTLTLLQYSLRHSEDPFETEQKWIASISSGKAHEFKGKLQCQACNEFGSGFAYVCPECEIFFDIRCPVSKPCLLNSELHQHPLALFTTEQPFLYCNACNVLLRSTFLRCVECKFNLHVDCLPKLPPTAKEKHHRHTLTLTDSPITDYPDEDVNSGFVCDACEERRYLYERTYYCEKCHYVAHVHCLLPEILPILEEEWSLACKLGESKLDIPTSECENNIGVGASKVLKIEEITQEDGAELERRAGVSTDNEVMARRISLEMSSKAEGARLAGDSFLNELDAEIVVLRSKVGCLATELKATKETLKELEERYAQLVASPLPNCRDSENV